MKTETVQTDAAGPGRGPSGFFRNLPKTAVIYPAALLGSVGLGCLNLGIVYYANESYGISPAQVGILAAVFNICYVIGCLFLRPLSRLLLPRYSVILAAALIGAWQIGIIYSTSVILLFTFHAMAGFSLSFFWPPMMGWTSAGIEGGALGRMMGRYNLSWSIGAICSPWIAAALSERAAQLPLQASALLFMSAAGIVLAGSLLLPGIGSDDDHHHTERKTRREKGNGTVLRYPAWIGLFCCFSVIGVLVFVFPLAARDELGFEKATVGVLLTVRALLHSASMVALGCCIWWHFRGSQMTTGSLLLACTMLALAFAGQPWQVALLLAFTGILAGQAYANSMFHGVSGSIRRAARMAIHEALIGGGLITGSAIGGMLYEQSGMRTLMTGCAGVALFTALAQYIIITAARGKP